MGEFSSSNHSIDCFGPTFPLRAAREAGLNIKKKKKSIKSVQSQQDCEELWSQDLGEDWKSIEVNLVFGSTFLSNVIADSESSGWDGEDWELWTQTHGGRGPRTGCSVSQGVEILVNVSGSQFGPRRAIPRNNSELEIDRFSLKPNFRWPPFAD